MNTTRHLVIVAYIATGISLLTLLAVLTALWYAHRALGDYMVIIHSAQQTITDAQAVTLEASGTLVDVQAALTRVDAMMGNVRATTQQAAQTTEAAQEAIQDAPTNVMRQIPILNWFVQ